MRIVTGAVWALFGLMQFQLSAFVFARHAAPGVVFLLAGIGILVGLFWNSTPLFLGGVICSLAGPLAVGLLGIEPFEWVHHLVRLAVVAVLILLWVRWWRRPVAPRASA